MRLSIFTFSLHLNTYIRGKRYIDLTLVWSYMNFLYGLSMNVMFLFNSLLFIIRKIINTVTIQWTCNLSINRILWCDFCGLKHIIYVIFKALKPHMRHDFNRKPHHTPPSTSLRLSQPWLLCHKLIIFLFCIMSY